jgi:hypothetical protein
MHVLVVPTARPERVPAFLRAWRHEAFDLVLFVEDAPCPAPRRGPVPCPDIFDDGLNPALTRKGRGRRCHEDQLFRDNLLDRVFRGRVESTLLLILAPRQERASMRSGAGRAFLSPAPRREAVTPPSGRRIR